VERDVRGRCCMLSLFLLKRTHSLALSVVYATRLCAPRTRFLWSEVPRPREAELLHARCENSWLELTQSRLSPCGPKCLEPHQPTSVLFVYQRLGQIILEDNLAAAGQRGYTKGARKIGKQGRRKASCLWPFSSVGLCNPNRPSRISDSCWPSARADDGGCAS
jgi:hypothetical protein